MKKKYLFIFITVIFVCITVAAISNQITLHKKKSNVVTVLNEKNIKNQVSQSSMTSIINSITTAPRPMGSIQEKKIASFLSKKLSKLGYITHKQSFDYTDKDIEFKYFHDPKMYFYSSIVKSNKSGSSQNIISIKKSEVKNAPILVLSAHYDTTKDSIGANDNASGVSVVLEIARIFKTISLPFDINFVLFSGEEKHWIGSRVYIQNLNKNYKKRIKGNINIDSVADKSENGYQLTTFREISRKIILNSDVSNYASQNIITNAFVKNKRIALFSAMDSDHYSFYMAGIPSATFGQKIDNSLMNTINSSKDTISKIDSKRLVETTKLIISAIEKLKKTGF